MVKDKKSLLLIGLYAAIIVVACYFGWRAWSLNKATENLYDVSFNQYQGNPEAEKIIVEFLDYRCSYCREVHPVMMEVLKRNPDVKIIYRHFPVFGRPSVIEAEVALAAGMQGKYAEAHNYLIQRKEPITDREINQLAQDLGLDLAKFRKDMKDPDMGYLLLSTLDMVEVIGIKSTPSFMVGDVVYTLQEGMPTPETFEKLLAKVYGG